MTGKVSISYNYNTYNTDTIAPYEAYLTWESIHGNESVIGRGATPERAKRMAIDTFKLIPPSEELTITEES